MENRDVYICVYLREQSRVVFRNSHYFRLLPIMDQINLYYGLDP